ncbi:hypothetical protein P152DRAFT_143240 [Eremomyces bilateralis CBS 781.70]|uniref:Uncharacterized protein n=1 Tax=Eremomyces bilateralis CBS 781.70 TaxID=1392243 RepID=A0A6G1FVW1_9PEZI|nr:uncharacterized protein P152DRAFT_143240 [Eremomyces bilateralis CBS 781.70]KAF1809913.1 hypothetical protein P152DRAFT_143240 [Eremomyces bilateralis CBS 781.70]
MDSNDIAEPGKMRLPPEILMQIIESIAPSSHSVILPATHPTTKAWLAWSLVCHATSSVAVNLLRKHCVYLDSQKRLGDFVKAILPGSHLPSVPAPAHWPLHPFLPLPGHWNVTAIYLAPEGTSMSAIIGRWIRYLCYSVYGTLRRLVVNLPSPIAFPLENSIGHHPVIWEGFDQLSQLEEFVSLRDDLYFPDRNWSRWLRYPTWTYWPKLKRLALYNLDANFKFWQEMAGLEMLEQLVLARTSSMVQRISFTSYTGLTTRPLKVVLANVESEQPQGLLEALEPPWVEQATPLDVMVYDIPTSFYGDEEPGELCQSWATSHAVQGTIWDWQGEHVAVEWKEQQNTQE